MATDYGLVKTRLRSRGPVTLDQIAKAARLPVDRVRPVAVRMVERGELVMLPDGRYRRR